MQGVKYTPYQKRYALKLWLDEKVPTLKVCQKCKCNERTLWRWKAAYDGTLESLENKSCRPLTPHPNSHTFSEVNSIKEVLSNKDITYSEAYGILRQEYAYSRSYGGFYNFVLKNNIRPKRDLHRYVPKPYDTPEMFGTKVQIDVKFVPRDCYNGNIVYGDEWKYYQYTAIDEATRERFIYPYKEHTIQSTLDFVKRMICFYGYIPNIIQTDNGAEFANLKMATNKNSRKHALDVLCDQLGIKHQRIRAYTPRLNGKVERSHRTDQEFFYNKMKFSSYEDLKNQMKNWNKRYNNKPHASLRNREGKKVWWNPNQKRTDLTALLEEKQQDFEKVRFINSNIRKDLDYLYS